MFFVDDDRRVYLRMLGEQSERFGLTLDGYCLMTNHVHLIATPREPDSLAKAVGRAHWHYTQYVNRLHGRHGHLWQNRFFSCALDGVHFRAAMIYVERNAVRARLVRRAWRYEWSSAAAHCGGRDTSELLDLAAWARLAPDGDLAGWRESLAKATDDEMLGRIRMWTCRGRPLGTDRFVARLERALGRRLRPLPVGRPRRRQVGRVVSGQAEGKKGDCP